MRLILKFYLFFLVLVVLSFTSFRIAVGDVQHIDPSKVKFTVGDSNEEADLNEFVKSASASKSEAPTEPEDVPEIKLDGLSAEELKKLHEQAETFQFQAEVSRMMKLIINSLYRNKEIFLRELISNASDALDKIRLLSLTNADVLKENDELVIRIMADEKNRMLHITDTGIGMSKKDLLTNLGTIAKSGTADFLAKMGESKDMKEMSDLIGQFGVGFYSAFLVADKVIVTSKNDDDPVQHIWESDSASFTVVDDPRGNTLKRGTTISLVLKEEASDFLKPDTLRKLIQKYSQFINFKIYLYSSKTEKVEEPIEEEKPAEDKTEEKKSEDDDAKVEDVKDEEKPKTKKVDKTTWDWELINTSKPIWTRKPTDITQEEYNEFYKAISKDTSEPMTMTHFIAEGEITFKSILFVPKVNPSDALNRYGTRTDNIKLFVRRVFITDDFTDMVPNYLSFIRGLVDSDDLPLNVSRETLQQHKLLKVIRKKLVRKVLEMFKKLSEEDFALFWKEYSTNIKLGILEDTANRGRLAKLLRFYSSQSTNKMTSLADYVKRMKEDQKHIYYIAGSSIDEVSTSPFVERLHKKGYEVLYMIDAVDEYCISSIPDFEGKKFQNVAKDGLELNSSEKSKEKVKELEKEFEPLKSWLQDNLLKDKIAKVVISQRLHESPCALVASQFGWTGNMERLALSNAHSKSEDSMRDYYLKQKKTLEINPRHPLIQELLRRITDDSNDQTAKDMGLLMFETATLRSGYHISDTASFAQRVEQLLRKTLGVDENAEVEEDDDLEAASPVKAKLEETVHAEHEEL